MSEIMPTAVDGALAEFAATGSEEAFRRIVAAYLPLVTGTAIRRTGGRRDLAEDIAQTVFIDLARRATSLPREVRLAGWLHRHTTFVSSKVLRGERRRMKRERVAGAAAIGGAPTAEALATLDDLLFSLGDESRLAVLMHCVEGRTHEEVGAALGITRAAAQKRVERALAQLRSSLGAGVTVTGLTAALAPPVAHGAEIARRIAAVATTAGRALPMKTPLGSWGGALRGAAAGLTLAAVPLAMAWRDLSAAREQAGSRRAATATQTVFQKPLDRGAEENPASTLTVEEYVDAVLALPGRYGFSEMAVARANALARSLPSELIQNAIVTLAQRMPESMCLAREWARPVFASLCVLWSPQLVPDDFLDVVRSLPETAHDRGSCLGDLATACARSDPKATRQLIELLRGAEARENWSKPLLHSMVSALTEAATEEALRRHPPEAVALMVDLLVEPSSGGSSPPRDLQAGLDLLRKGVNDPVLRAPLVQALGEVTAHRARAILEPLLMVNLTLSEWQRFVEAVPDPGLRAVSATAATTSSLVLRGPSKPDRDALLAWWETQVAAEHRPEVAPELARSWPLEEYAQLISWVERLGGREGDAAFDRLRAAAAENLAPREGDAPDPPRTLAPGLALQIVDPDLRIAVLASVMRAWNGPEAEEWKRKHLPPEVAADLSEITNPSW